MPIGSPIFAANAQGAANVGTLVGGTAQVQAQYGQISEPESVQKAPYLLLGVIVLYLVWAIAIQHERIRDQLAPANVAVNLHNLVIVGTTAMVFILLGKIATAKATILGFPGASWVAQLFQAV